MNEAHGPGGAGFGGRPVVIFESRNATEMASLVARHGGAALSAPSMREIAIGPTPAALEIARELDGGRFDAVLLLTGVGTRALLDAFAPELDPARALAALGRAAVVVRGPKPAQLLRKLGFTGFVVAPEPNTWREAAATLIHHLEAHRAGGPSGARVLVQEYGVSNGDLLDALHQRGVVTQPLPVYRWALPDDTAPLRAGLHQLAGGGARIALFTSARQIEHALGVAVEEGVVDGVLHTLRRGLVASIGPVCSEALRDAGLPPDVEPKITKMGHLVKEAALACAGVLAAKG